MALDNAAFKDLRNFVKRRVCYMQYRIGSTYVRTPISDVEILANGVVRVKATIVPNATVTINRVELYNNNSEIWAHQDVRITIDRGQTGVMFWFDFTIKEGTA